MSRALLRYGLVGVIVAALAQCDSGPKAGDLTAELTAPAELGAAMFKVTIGGGYTVDDLTAACSGCRAFMTRVSDREVRGIVTGPFTSGPLVHVGVSDRTAPEAYTIQLMQVALTDYTLDGLVGKTLTFVTR
jgi:hypothetical protein